LCYRCGTNYPLFANKINNYNTQDFKDRAIRDNISQFGDQIGQIRDQNSKNITTNIRFTDGQRCIINLRRRENLGNIETQTQNCVCPGLEVIEPSKDSNSQVPVSDAPVSDASVTVPVTDAPGRQY